MCVTAMVVQRKGPRRTTRHTCHLSIGMTFPQRLRASYSHDTGYTPDGSIGNLRAVRQQEKMTLFPTTLTGQALFPLYIILCAVRVKHSTTADLLIVAPFSRVLFAISKDPCASTVSFV